MAKDVTLHYFPASYFSLKAVLTLHEKGIPFKESVVNIYNGEQHNAWFRKLNPKTQVPVLQVGDQAVPDSEAIIDYVEYHWPDGPTLVPDVETAVGQDVHAMRNLLHAVPIGNVTFGVLANRKFCTSVPRLPVLMNKMLNRPGIIKRFGGNVDKVRANRDKASGEARADLTTKLENSEKFLASVLDEERVSTTLDDLDQVFDKMENQLEKSRKESMSGESYWLCGRSFTAADVIATTLMYRLYLIGIDSRYFSEAKRAIVQDYFDRLLDRPAVKKTIACAESVGKVLAWNLGWKVVKVGVVVGVAILGLWASREVITARRGLRKV